MKNAFRISEMHQETFQIGRLGLHPWWKATKKARGEKSKYLIIAALYKKSTQQIIGHGKIIR